jgi:hypothetical protein
MNYLLDNTKVYYILGIVALIWLYCVFSKPKSPPETYTITPIKTQAVVGSEPRYFNTEIYSMPGARGDPYMLFGSKMPGTSAADPIKLGFERLLPQIEQLPKMGMVQAYALQAQPTTGNL